MRTANTNFMWTVFAFLLGVTSLGVLHAGWLYQRTFYGRRFSESVTHHMPDRTARSGRVDKAAVGPDGGWDRTAQTFRRAISVQNAAILDQTKKMEAAAGRYTGRHVTHEQGGGVYCAQ